MKLKIGPAYRGVVSAVLASLMATAAMITSASAQAWDWRGDDDRTPQWRDDRRFDDARDNDDRSEYRRGNRYDGRREFPRELQRPRRHLPALPPRYEPEYNPQYDPRYENDQPRPDEGAWPGDVDEPDQDQRRSYTPRRPLDSYRERPGDRDLPEPAARPPQTEQSSDGVITADGGAQPYLPAVAPPVVAFNYNYPPGSVVVDTGGRALYYVINMTRAYRYPIAVGKAGFAWTGIEKVSRIADWPDWNPPAEMRARKPELHERMSGGLRNPLGARAIYLGNTLYRIHGTNDPKSIGRAESSGCIRMLNQHAVHLGSLVSVGTEVHVVRALTRNKAAS